MAAPLLLNPQVLASGIGAIGSLGSSLLGGLMNRNNMAKQVQASKDLMDYEWEKYKSPSAQVNALAAAGINPAVALGQGGSGFTATPSPVMPTAPNFVPPSIGDVSSFMLALANAKKMEADAKKAGVETKNIEVETQAKQFDLELSKIFAAPEKYAALTLAWKNVVLADDEHSIKEWTKEKEKMLAQTQGVQRDTLQKVLDNMDTQIKLENQQKEEDIKLIQEKQKTEKTSQSANLASANASNAAAAVSRENRRLQSALADVEEAGKVEKINSLIAEYKSKGLISDADAKEAQIKLDRLNSVEDKRSTSFFREVDNYLEWLKNKVSIFKTK